MNKALPSKLGVIKEQDLLWLAGYLEGEGTFSGSDTWRKDGSYRFAPVVAATSCDKDVLEKIAIITGVGRVLPCVKNGYNVKEIYTWTISAKNTVLDLLKRLKPYMGLRRQERIQEVILKIEQSR